MSASVVQLIARGPQDIYLTSYPQVTFFKSVYHRYSSFATEYIQQIMNGNPGPGSRVSVTLSRNGDLISDIVIAIRTAKLFEIDPVQSLNVCADLGHAIFQSFEIEIGGQIIDTQYSKWLTIWRDLTEVNQLGIQGIPSGTRSSREPDCIGIFNGNPPESVNNCSTVYQRMSFTHKNYTYVPGQDIYKSNPVFQGPPEFYIPLRFWFCRNPGLALPLISLQYHEIKLNIVFNNIKHIFNQIPPEPVPPVDPPVPPVPPISITTNYSSNISIYTQYVYLDTAERKRFAQNTHEYLIEQVQYQKATGNQIKLNFNHPVKELIVTGSYEYSSDSSFNYPATPLPIVPGVNTSTSYYNMMLKFNGTDRFSARNLNYFTRNQIWDHHTGFGSVLFPDSIAVYSFAIRPEEHQPSGTCNFSRIDNAILVFDSFNSTINNTGLLNNLNLDIYAVNLNIFRVMSGMGGLAYSN